MMGYAEFIAAKKHIASSGGFEPASIPDFLYDFQAHLVDWAVRKGRAAIFADCGLGKTPMQLAWGDNIVRKTGKPVLLLTPLAVAAQTEIEAEKFGIDGRRSADGTAVGQITITNYEKLQKFSPDDFSGVICDESSILKAFDGTRRREITQFMKQIQYRLLATATAAPNDYTELGTSSEALGFLGHVDMLNRFFTNDRNNTSTKRMYGEAPEWRFKGHAEEPFWQWVTSWARACRKPSDLGFDDDRFQLPSLNEQYHIVHVDHAAEGMLFNLPAVKLDEQREERKRTLTERCQKVAELVADTGEPALVWCHMNAEGDLLEKIIPGAVQVSGSDSDERKEEKLLAFARGDIRVLVTKPKIGAWGLNFQNCNHVVYFPSHSYEAYYQAVRRCWRFGQKRDVHVDIVLTEGERRVMENLQQKAKAADKMFERLVGEMGNAMEIKTDAMRTKPEEVPQWL